MLSRMPRALSSHFCQRVVIPNRLAATALLALTCALPTPALCFGASRNPFVSKSPFGVRSLTKMASSSVEETMDTTVAAETSSTVSPDPKLDSLRNLLQERNLDIYLVPSDDPHLSEYVPDAYKRRAFLSGFNGSAGTAVVGLEGAWLWTDSRYFNEASLDLDPNHWTLQKQGQPGVPTMTKFLSDMALDRFKENGKPLVIAMDPYVHAASFAKELNEALEKTATEESIEAKIGVLDTSHENLVDIVWGDERPAIPTSPFRVHPMEFAGMSVEDKVAKIREGMQEKKTSLAVFCTLDDVAYLMNMRAMGDVETCPVGIAYATVSNDTTTLYCDSKKVESPEVQKHLEESNVVVKPYDDIVNDVKAHCDFDSNKVWIDKSRANLALCNVVPEAQLLNAQNAVTGMKACKNDAEMAGMRRAHVVDGAAMANFMAWISKEVQKRKVSEVEIDEVLTGFRAKQRGFLEVSFPTIAGVGSNGAIIHYRAQEDTDLLQYLDTEKPILIDSGGQYLYGTTDVTRTWHFGTPTKEFVDSYTRVLKGNIGVDVMQFPENTPGFVLDVFARRALWEAQQDYGHGTGHGVGAALNVHEGPQSISPRFANTEGLKQGMVISNEPGYYEDGNYGVRIENLLEIQYVKEDVEEGKKKFLKFVKLTMIPIQKNLINLDLMTEQELDWLDGYHQEVFEKISPLLEPDSPAMEWLTKSCEKIERKK